MASHPTQYIPFPSTLLSLFFALSHLETIEIYRHHFEQSIVIPQSSELKWATRKIRIFGPKDKLKEYCVFLLVQTFRANSLKCRLKLFRWR